MKRKKELTPCEEKALVHLQALQIKEKEAKAKQRAKKRKVNTAVAGQRIALAGQNLPFQPVPSANVTQDTRPFYPTQNPLPTRNEWNQLIPAAAQTAQLMLLNHAMQQQGIKKNTEGTQTGGGAPPGRRLGRRPPGGGAPPGPPRPPIQRPLLGPAVIPIIPERPIDTTRLLAPPPGPGDDLNLGMMEGSFEDYAPPEAIERLSKLRERFAKKNAMQNAMQQLKDFPGTTQYQLDQVLQGVRNMDVKNVGKMIMDYTKPKPVADFDMTPAQFEEYRNEMDRLIRTASVGNVENYQRRLYIDTILKENIMYNMDREEAKQFFNDTTRARPSHISLTEDGRRYISAGRIRIYEDGRIGTTEQPEELQSLEEKQRIQRNLRFNSLLNRPAQRSGFQAFRRNLQSAREQNANDFFWRQFYNSSPQSRDALMQGTSSRHVDAFIEEYEEWLKNNISNDLSNVPADKRIRKGSQITSADDEKEFLRQNPNYVPPNVPPQPEDPEDIPPPLAPIEDELDGFMEEFGYEPAMHDTFLAFSKTSKQAQRRFMRGIEDEATRQQFRSQFRRWKEHTSNILQPEELESMYGGFQTFFEENPPPPITPTKLEPPREQPLVEETPRTLVKSYLSQFNPPTPAGLANEPPVSPPKAPVAPVSDAQKMLTPQQLNQYPSWNKENVSTPLRQSGSRQQAIEMSNMFNDINTPWLPTSYTLPAEWNYNHPTNVAKRAQATANSQFFKQNELFSQKYVIPRNPNARQFNMYPLKLQSLLKTHFMNDQALRNSVTFNKQQLEALRRAPNESFVDTVDYFLSQNYPKQNQQPIPDKPVNESSGMQPLEIEDKQNIPVQSDNSGFDNENIVSEMENVGPSFVGE
jgi:hypothetical protein